MGASPQTPGARCACGCRVSQKQSSCGDMNMVRNFNSSCEYLQQLHAFHSMVSLALLRCYCTFEIETVEIEGNLKQQAT